MNRRIRDSFQGFAALVLAPAIASAGVLDVVPAEPTSRDATRVRFHESQWFDPCPPSLQSVEVEGRTIRVTAGLPPDSGCILVIAQTPYTILADVGRLATGTWDVVFETLDYQTREPVITETSFEVGDAVGCELGRRPAATLFLPYFEADLDSPSGRRTLVSVGTVSPESTLARVVLWTDWGWPRLSFDLALPADGVVSLDVANLLRGDLPETALPEGTGSATCTSPLTQPEIDPTTLRALFTGQPDPESGLCFASSHENGVATGSLTIDVVRDCSGAESTDPFSNGYFDGPDPLADSRNVLYGDFFLLDPAADLAQGEPLVSLPADSERFGVPGDGAGTSARTFYGLEDDRRPLPHAVRGRFFDGGGFSGATDLLVWTEGTLGPTDCEETGISFDIFDFSFWTEDGEQLAETAFSADRLTQRLRVGEPPLELDAPFGVFDVESTYFNGVIGVPLVEDQQVWALPLLEAENRFGVGLAAAPVEDFCR